VTVPADAATLVAQALDAIQARQWDRAEQLAAQALAIAPQSYQARQVRALAPYYAGRPADALPHAETLASRFPTDPFAHSTFGTVLHAVGRVEQAIKAYQRAISLAPGHAISWLNLGQAHWSAGQAADAASCYEKAIALGARMPEAYLGLANSRIAADDMDAALPPAREAARLAPVSVDAVRTAAQCELEVGQLPAALEGYRRLEALAPPASRWRFLRAVLWPAVMESRAQIAERLAQVNVAVDDLIAHPEPIADPLHEVAATAFYMAYQAFDDTALQEKIARAYRLACPSLEWSAPHLGSPRRAGRIRLGIVGRHLNNHTIGKLNIGIAQKIDRQRFELVVMRPPGPRDFLAGAFDECADRTVTLPFDLPQARRMVAAAELDAIFYPDIGMDVFTYYLAFARLARVQFTTWGHPVTTGIPNMDFFVSTRHAEPPDGQRFYSERLVEFASPPSFYYRPRPPSPFDLHAHLGLAKDVRIYASMQTLYKVHPDFDDALVDILRRDAKGRAVLIAAKRAAWNDKLRARIARAGPDVADRLIFMPPVSLPDYLGALRAADALLDTFHFGGGCSSYESFGMSAPVVTLPGAHMRARITAGLYGRMGVSRWIADSPARFAQLALEMADGAQRAQWVEEIEAGASRFLEDEAVVREYEGFVEAALEGKLARNA
jgi:predicted O-linked N-acetylglucosamine transferase (SPINDLY family)